MKLRFALGLAFLVATILEINQNGLWAQNKEEQVDIDRCEVTMDEFKDSDSGMKKFFSDAYGSTFFQQGHQTL